ncbi:sperm acrosome-associated protein 9 [Colossoma macropomum]|uniref:sperm acrosome-associated protein 9 n=1 Tax=Colossoma macropomum TaxID=42526 RepID=UPI001865274B|nr:sperm acrosome-associated protein 9 [Colossoma macropomum]XP_036454094.1 sperm acrosome-associated protein 9 [Colossoma macropomum]XP_036454095.1 sperm acrosome-associated protein 9 [Colossoma macropomum]
MNEVRERLLSIEQRHKGFKQQQFTFIAALERSRERAHDKTEPVSSVAQVQKYMTHHCSNATDRRIFSLFLDIMADLEVVFKLVEFTLSAQSHSSEALETCKKLLSPNCNISQLRADYPHDEINRLSCNEARNYYGGVVSVIPLALDLLKVASFKRTSTADQTLPPPTPTTANRLPQQPIASTAGNMFADQSKKTTHTSTQSAKAMSKGTGRWHAGKPAWRPPGRTRI